VEELRTFYTQRMLEQGFLAGTSIYPTLSHSEVIVELYGNTIDEVFSDGISNKKWKYIRTT